MHYPVVVMIFIVLGLSPALANASTPLPSAAGAATPSHDSATPAPSPPAPDRQRPDAGGATPASADDPVCQTLLSAAALNDLPADFLTRLIWQESRFDAQAVSRAGAQGIAQFMPGTAAWMRLDNPFDAVSAITKSAVLLGNLRNQFGNLGLAAAAYNAGPKRVADWLANRRNLPAETRAYIRIVTGHPADEWRGGAPTELAVNLPGAVPCQDLVRLFAGRPRNAAAPKPPQALAVAAPSTPPWGVQLIGGLSQSAALASFYQMQRTYHAVIGSRQPLVLRSPAGRNAYWYRVRIGADTRVDAERLCSNLRTVGGSCLVQPN